MPTRSRVVLLMHPHEFKKRKSNTGLLTCLHLENSEYLFTLDLDNHPRVRELRADPGNYCMLLYPGPQAVDISERGFSSASLPGYRPELRLVIFLLDATWSLAHKLLRDNPGLLELPQFRLQPRQASRYVIKRQPKPYCLSTIETVHEILLSLEEAGLDEYADKSRLIAGFMAMQKVQLDQAAALRNPRHHTRSKSAGSISRPVPQADSAP